MSDPSREQQPYDDEESDFGSKLKVRLAIAGALVALALAAIPILDNLTGKKNAAVDNSAGNIVSSAGLATTPAPASAPVASAPVASSQPVGTAPTGPDLSQTPGMTATTPLTLAAAAPAAAPQTTPVTPAVRSASGPVRPQHTAPLTHDSRAFKPGSAPTQPYNAQQAPVYAAAPAPNQPAPQAQPPQNAASPVARPAGTSVGYNVQLGLFNNLDNAQKLITELRSKGIEVQSETRIHLAPFRTRAEAEQAIAKLRALGYAPMLNAAGN